LVLYAGRVCRLKQCHQQQQQQLLLLQQLKAQLAACRPAEHGSSSPSSS
jgi:hypothetical protein